MAFDNPSRIAVLGAGPIGLESALYARFLGFDVDLYEQGGVAANVRQWGHVRMFSPFSMNASPLGLAALAAQSTQFEAPDPDELLRGDEFAERYLIPLSQTDLLSDSIQAQTQVISVSREGFLKNESIGRPERAGSKFLILITDRDGGEQYRQADIVVDATGSWNQPRYIGVSGMPALGERALRDDIEYHVPDVLGAERQRYGGRHTLVLGSGYSAATSVTQLARLAESEPNTRITWLTRSAEDAPITPTANDPLTERDRITTEANILAVSPKQVRHLKNCEVERVSRVDDHLEVEIAGATPETLAVDRMIANVGFKPNTSMLSELQLHQCYATDGPMKLAALLLSSSATDCLHQPKTRAESLMTSETNFYVIGSKSYGRNSQFLISSGLTQIQELFTVIANRETLNLYDNMKTHPH